MFSAVMDKTEKGVHIYGRKSICEVHRQIYDVLITEIAVERPDVIEKIVPLLETAFIMGIKINKRLTELKLTELTEILKGEDFDAEQAVELRKERIRLVILLDQNKQTLKEYEDTK